MLRLFNPLVGYFDPRPADPLPRRRGKPLLKKLPLGACLYLALTCVFRAEPAGGCSACDLPLAVTASRTAVGVPPGDDLGPKEASR